MEEEAELIPGGERGDQAPPLWRRSPVTCSLMLPKLATVGDWAFSDIARSRRLVSSAVLGRRSPVPKASRVKVEPETPGERSSEVLLAAFIEGNCIAFNSEPTSN